MRIVRLDEKTVKCFLSNEELKEYELEYNDFITRSEKARELVQEIMKRASEEVGYEPPQFAIEMQVMIVPEQGVVLTFADKDADGMSMLKNGLEYLKSMFQQELEQNGGENTEKDTDILPPSSFRKKEGSVQETPAQEVRKDLAIFCFASIARVMEYAALLPANLRVESALYKMDDFFFVKLEKAGASFKRFGKACIQALEFGTLYSAEEKGVLQLENRGECLIPEKALKVLAKKQTNPRESE